MLAAGSALVTAVAVRPAGVMERDAKNDEVSQNSSYGVSPAEGEPQSCPGGEAGVCGDQPHPVVVINNISCGSAWRRRA